MSAVGRKRSLASRRKLDLRAAGPKADLGNVRDGWLADLCFTTRDTIKADHQVEELFGIGSD